MRGSAMHGHARGSIILFVNLAMPMLSAIGQCLKVRSCRFWHTIRVVLVLSS
jgi:hypothetical protein